MLDVSRQGDPELSFDGHPTNMHRTANNDDAVWDKGLPTFAQLSLVRGGDHVSTNKIKQRTAVDVVGMVFHCEDVFRGRFDRGLTRKRGEAMTAGSASVGG